MKLKIILVVFAIMVGQLCHSQSIEGTRDYIVLAKALALYGSSPELRGFQKEMNLVTNPDMTKVKEFVNALVLRRQLFGTDFLKKQDSLTLRRCYIVIELSQYIGGTEPSKQTNMAKQVMLRDLPMQEMEVAYYSVLFRAAVKPPILEYVKKKHLDFKELGIETSKDKGIVFLTAIAAYGIPVIRALHVEDPRNFDTAEFWVSIAPRVEEKTPYYHYKDFDFEDFKVKIGGQYQSFKSYHLTQYYNLLLGHLMVLNEKKGKEAEIKDLKDNSILFKNKYYNLLESDTREVLLGLNIATEKPKGDLAAADDALNAKDFETAIKLYEGELEKEKDKPKVLEKLAYAYFENERLDDAYKSYFAYSELVGASPLGFYGMAQVQHAKGDLASALRNAKKALTRFEEIQPAKVSSGLGLLGMIYFDMGDTKIAKSYLKKAHKEGYVVPDKYAKALGIN